MSQKSKIRKRHLFLLLVQLIGMGGFIYAGIASDFDKNPPIWQIMVPWLVLAVATIAVFRLKCEGCKASVFSAMSGDMRGWPFTKKSRQAMSFTFSKHCPQCGMERE